MRGYINDMFEEVRRTREIQVASVIREMLRCELTSAEHKYILGMLTENPVLALNKLKQIGYEIIIDSEDELGIDKNTEIMTIRVCRIIATQNIKFVTDFSIGGDIDATAKK